MKKLKIDEDYKKFDGKILKTMCKIAIPSVIQQSIVSVGLVCLQSVINGFGPVAMAGYTAAGKIDTLAILPMSNMGNAVSTFAAQNVGARKLDRVPKGLKAGIIAVVGTGLVIAGLLFIFGKDLVSLFVRGEGADAVIAEGAGYLRISGTFYFLFGILNCCAGLLRGAGDMKGFLTVCLLNFGMRVLVSFVVAARVGLYMVAWATVIGWVCGMLFGIFRYKTGKWKEKRII